MKKTNLKKYILEALGTLLIIAAVAGMHKMSEREVYASDPITKAYVKVNGTQHEISTTNNVIENIESIERVEITGVIAALGSYSEEIEVSSNIETNESDISAGGNLLYLKGKVSYSLNESEKKLTITFSGIDVGLRYEFVNVADFNPVDVDNGTTAAEIKSKLPNASINVKDNVTESNETWTGISVEWDNEPEGSSYDAEEKTATSLTWNGIISSGLISNSGKELILDAEKEVSVNVKVAEAIKHTFKSVIAPSAITVDNATTTANILSKLNSQYANVSIIATNSSTLGDETLTDAAKVTWDQSPKTTYDESSKSAQTLTWEGTVSASSTSYYGLEIPADTTTTITVNVSAMSPSNYTNVKAGSTVGDDDNFKISLDIPLVKSILSAQSGDIRTAIDQAISDGNEITLKLNIEEGDVSSSDEDKMEDKASDSKSGAKIGKTFDLTLKLYVAGEDKGKITDTNGNSIKITYTLSDSLKSSSSSKGTRYYRTYYYHNGSVGTASDWEKASSSKISFKATKFSPYAIAYYDEGSSSSSSSSSAAASNSASVRNTIDTTSGNAGSGKSPKTGDNFNPRIWIYLLIVAATIATCAGVLLHDTKDTDEAERK